MRRGVIVKTLRCCAELNCRGCPLEKLREGRGCTTKLAKEVLKQMQADDAERRKQYAQIAGAGLILWTCREGELLENALEACARWGLHFDAVNDSLPSWKKFYGNDTRKVGATEYWDDKAYRVQNGKLMKEAAHEMD